MEDIHMNARDLKSGTYGGLAGGVVFGALMWIMGTLPMIGQMVGQPSAAVGAVVHLANSAIIGAGFAIVLGRFASDVGSGFAAGALYGAAWWLLGPLTLMPLFMGMGLGVNWNGAAAVAMLPSLGGHLMYGTILGTTYAWLGQRRESYARAASS
jgi:hypothetical protein